MTSSLSRPPVTISSDLIKISRGVIGFRRKSLHEETPRAHSNSESHPKLTRTDLNRKEPQTRNSRSRNHNHVSMVLAEKIVSSILRTGTLATATKQAKMEREKKPGPVSDVSSSPLLTLLAIQVPD